MKTFSKLIESGVSVRELEPGLYSALEKTDRLNSYDGIFGDFYDLVACNPVYNKIMWGYSSRDFETILRKTLDASEGPVLDAGCGSLAFTHRAYRGYTERPVVFLDQSKKLLRMAKRRIADKNGCVPEHFMILQGDAFALPFAKESFATVISMNLLHVLPEIDSFLQSMKRMIRPGGELLCSTLVRSGRFGDGVLKKWEKAGEVMARSIEDVKSSFEKNGFAIMYEIRGNVAFIKTRKDF